MSSHTLPFLFCSASTTGREHLRLGRNNQDAVAASWCDEGFVLAVADGCSSGGANEVGARIGVAWAARHALRAFGGGEPFSVAVESFAHGLVAQLGVVAEVLGGPTPRIVNDHLLFSLLVAVVTPRATIVFGSGDGAFAIDGALHTIDPGPDNAPDYLGYALVGRSVAPKIFWVGRSEHLRSIVLGTDGAAGVALELSADPRLERNPSLLQKRLNVLARERALFDDATLAVALRRTGGAS